MEELLSNYSKTVRDMPPDGYKNLTVNEEVIEMLDDIMKEYDCNSYAEAVEKSAEIALKHDSDLELIYEIMKVLSEYSDEPSLSPALRMMERSMN